MRYTDIYDRLIQISAGAFLQPWDWLWWKAQLIAESGLNPLALSPAQALGLAQFMPDTWREVRAQLNLPADARADQPEHAIRAGAFYMGRMRGQFARVQRTEDERRKLAQAAYNAGLGNILRAQQLANGAPGYDDIIEQLARVTGEKNAAETRTYVVRIERIYNELRAAP